MPAAELHLRYVLAILGLLAPGRGLTREPGSNVYQVAEGLAVELARIDERTADARREMIPWQAVEMLPDWEALLGITAPSAVASERQAAVKARIQGDGPPTRPGMEAIAAALGYTLTWHRDAPFVCGASTIGYRCGGVGRIYTWTARYTSDSSSDALLEQLLTAYAGEHAGGRLNFAHTTSIPWVTQGGTPYVTQGGTPYTTQGPP